MGTASFERRHPLPFPLYDTPVPLFRRGRGNRATNADPRGCRAAEGRRKRVDMNLETMIAAMKSSPGFDAAGMILCHNGVVRNCSRNGRPVTGLRVSVDHERLADIVKAARSRPGIVDVQVFIAADRDLSIGEDVMLLAVAGDVRENVIAVLTETLESIKTSATRKTEFLG